MDFWIGLVAGCRLKVESYRWMVEGGARQNRDAVERVLTGRVELYRLFTVFTGHEAGQLFFWGSIRFGWVRPVPWMASRRWRYCLAFPGRRSGLRAGSG